ncbi:MAG TPA: peptide deformylase [Gaiellaceae bacterium]|nr:peptide deformylase [Gaiellaceae bacterium]
MSDHDHHHGHDHDHEDDELDEDAAAEAEVEARRQLALAQIRQYGDPVLRMQANEVVEVDDDVRRLVERMTSLMEDAQGVGLAATQVGILRRLFVFVNGDDGPQAIVNPTIIERAEETDSDEEGCLSLQGVKVPVERSVRVVLEGLDANGKPVRYELSDYDARVVQHELDHLDGVLIIDRTDDEHRRNALRILRPRVVLR